MTDGKRDPWRLRYHLMPPDGWLNDPNGLCQHNGVYHVYFQYAPNVPAPDGRKARTWGHYAGLSLTDLAFRGVPFWPEEPDKDGCYSGCALTGDDGIRLYYTGNVKEPGEHDFIHTGRLSNTILIRTADGGAYGPKEVLLRTEDYPKTCTRHVRDPKVWIENGTYYMVLGARLSDDRGAVLLYESPDGISWKYDKTLETEEAFGYMWECPDYFELDGQGYLSFCPQGVPSEEAAFQNLHSAGYMAVDGLCAKGEPVLHPFREWDFGFDFYAQQTFEDEAGRRLMFVWAGMPDKPYENPTAALGWENCLTVPREIVSRGDRLLQRPAAELAALRTGEEKIAPDGAAVFPEGAGDIGISFPGTKAAGPWRITFGKGAELSFRDGFLTLSFDEETGRGRTARRAKAETVRDLRILVDTSMLEIFVNGGEFTMTSRFYPAYGDDPSLAVGFSLGEAEVTAWRMRTMKCNEAYFGS